MSVGSINLTLLPKGSNVKCAACGEYGHMCGDPDCMMFFEAVAFNCERHRYGTRKAELEGQRPDVPAMTNTQAEEIAKEANEQKAA